MSTIEDFENAPVGATAEDGKWVKARPTNSYYGEWVEVLAPSSLKAEGESRSNESMAGHSYTLDPSPVTPTTAREALNMAWELAHPVKEGQVIPAGTLCLAQFDDGYQSYETPGEVITSETLPDIRTFDPLPDPEPDWLEAPAVLAWSRWDDVRREKVWSKDDRCYKSIDGEIANWSDLCYVTPLYPKDES